MKALQFFALFMMVSLAGCADGKEARCAQYVETLRNVAKREQLIRWVDSEIFAKTFKDEDFDLLSPGGFGRGGKNFLTGRFESTMPDWMGGYSVRSAGSDRNHPDVLIVGRGRSQGIVVSRGDIAESLGRTTIPPSVVEEVSGRLAMICIND